MDPGPPRPGLTAVTVTVVSHEWPPDRTGTQAGTAWREVARAVLGASAPGRGPAGPGLQGRGVAVTVTQSRPGARSDSEALGLSSYYYGPRAQLTSARRP